MDPLVADPRPRLEAALSGGRADAPDRIFDAFLRVARERPTATAIVEAGRVTSYGELERLTRALAARLRAHVAPNELVAIYGKRDARTVAALLASGRAGATFSVLDSAYPPRRLAQLFSGLGAARLLVLDATPDDERALAAIASPEAIVRVNLADLDARPGDAPVDEVSPTELAYVLFTSGTTGVPKAIATTHAPLVHFVKWYASRFEATAGARFSMLSGLAHDPIFRDIFVPLSVGAELHIPDGKLLANPTGLFHWLDESGVSHVHGTPQLFGIVVTGKVGDTKLRRVRYLLSGGDTLRRSRALQLLDVAPGATVVNFYGATETPQAMGHHVLDPADPQDPVPVGKGIADTQVLVLDDRGDVAPVGAVGQVAIRTRYLAAGYLNDAHATNERFRPNPRGGDVDDRLYLTGDLGYFRSDGAVIVTGRGDDQVKVRGFRVELGEIAQQLERLPSVEAAIVLPDPTARGETRLVAYLAGAGQTATVQTALAAVLPAYMVPNLYVWLPALPLLPNGKIDRAQLRPPALTAGEGAVGLAAPEGAVETAIVGDWKQLLGLPAIGVASTFVELGGDSLSFIQASMKLEALLGTLPNGWEHLSIRELAARAARGPARASRLSTVDTSVLVRAVSIVGIVVSHIGSYNLKGSTMALFIVAGMSFSRYQVNAVLRAGSVGPVLRSVFKIALPTILYTLLLQVMFSSPKWQSLLLVNNFVDPNFDNGLNFWFLDLLVQNQLILAALLTVLPLRRAIDRRPFASGWLLWLAFFGVSVFAPRVWDMERLFNRVPPASIWLMLFGWALAKADTTARKGLCLLSGLAAFTLSPLNYGEFGWFPATVLVLLLFVPRVRLPRALASGTNLVAGASLFIYLTHAQIASFAHKVHALDRKPAVTIVLAVVAGIATWKVWEKVYSALSLKLRQARSPGPDVALAPLETD